MRLTQAFTHDEFPEVGWDDEMYEIVGEAGEISHFEMLGPTLCAYVTYTDSEECHESWWSPLSLLEPA